MLAEVWPSPSREMQPGYRWSANETEIMLSEAAGNASEASPCREMDGPQAAEMQPRCSRDEAEMQPRYSRDAAEMQPRCSRDIAEM